MIDVRKIGSLDSCKHTNWEPRAETCPECDYLWLELRPQTEFMILSVPYHRATITGFDAEPKPAKKGFEFL